MHRYPLIHICIYICIRCSGVLSIHPYLYLCKYPVQRQYLLNTEYRYRCRNAYFRNGYAYSVQRYFLCWVQRYFVGLIYYSAGLFHYPSRSLLGLSASIARAERRHVGPRIHVCIDIHESVSICMPISRCVSAFIHTSIAISRVMFRKWAQYKWARKIRGPMTAPTL